MGSGHKIVLASTSSRRATLMEGMGLAFEVADPGNLREIREGEPTSLVRGNAVMKVRAVASGREEGIVVGADTVIVLDGIVLGKAGSRAEAKSMLRALRGREHRVLTGLAILDAGTGREASEVVETKVRMRPLSDGEVEAYVSTGEPLGKAGGYAIQGLGGSLVEGFEGSFNNVVGLPLSRLRKMLGDFGVDVPSDIGI
ncbi:MAG: Maf family protein [Candidatus Bathyarchaeota archaeon]|jgi:septum formation protein